MTLAIVGIGTAQPETIITQDEAMELARVLCCRTEEHTTWVPTIYDGTSIKTRGLIFGRDVVRDVLEGTRHTQSVFLPTGQPDDAGPSTAQRMQHYAELAPPLALRATRQALIRSRLAPETLTHLVTVSCTGFNAPGIDLALIRELHLRPTIERTHVGFMGCHGALNGLRVARALAGADPQGRVLLCAVELCSLHYHYGWDPQKIIANALFADGAAAVVGIPTQATAAPSDSWCVTATGSCLLPDSSKAMTWTIRDHGFEMTLSRRVPGLITQHLRPWLESWLEQQGLQLADIRSWAIHPGGPRIVDAVEEGLLLPTSATTASRTVLAECGNMSSPTLLFILDRLQASEKVNGAQRPCVALGFGPGVMAEAVLLK